MSRRNRQFRSALKSARRTGALVPARLRRRGIVGHLMAGSCKEDRQAKNQMGVINGINLGSNRRPVCWPPQFG